MFSYCWSQYKLTLPPLACCGLVLGMGVLLALSGWQWARAVEKQHYLADAAAFATKPPQAWQPGAPLPAQYQAIRVKGTYQPPILFLDNQYHQHQWGYHVVSAVQLDAQTWALVDRGWVPGQMTRQILPVVSTPLKRQTILGRVYYPTPNRWISENAVEQRAEGVVLGQLLPKTLSPLLHRSFLPFIIRLSPQAAHGFVREWVVVSMSPARHIGYALQWLVLAILFAGSMIAYHVKHV